MLPVVLTTELCPALWAKPRREIVLEVCISLHSSAYPHHYHCTTAGSLQAKGLCNKSKRKKKALVSRSMSIQKSWENATKMLSETHRRWTPFCSKSQCMWTILPVEAELLPSVHILQQCERHSPVWLCEVQAVWGWGRKLLTRPRQSVIPGFRLLWTSASTTHI